MGRAWCVCCEVGGSQSNTGYYWVCGKCLRKLMHKGRHVESIKKMLEGNHVRNRNNEDKIDVIYNFLKDIEDFERRLNTMKMIRGNE